MVSIAWDQCPVAAGPVWLCNTYRLSVNVSVLSKSGLWKSTANRGSPPLAKCSLNLTLHLMLSENRLVDVTHTKGRFARNGEISERQIRRSEDASENIIERLPIL